MVQPVGTIKGFDMDVLDLGTATSVEQIAKFNSRFIPEPRLSDPEFVKWKFRTTCSNGDSITTHYGLMNHGEIVAEMSIQPISSISYVMTIHQN